MQLRWRRRVLPGRLVAFVALLLALCALLLLQILDTPSAAPEPSQPPPPPPPTPTLSEANIRDMIAQAEAANGARVQRLQQVCRRHNMGLFRNSAAPPDVHEPPTPQYGVFYFDKTHKLAWCPIYKAASTTWLYQFCLLAGLSEAELAGSQKQLSELARSVLPELDYPEAEEQLQSSLKLVVVRHPFARLLSAYRDKLENSVAGLEHGTLHYYRRYGRRIVARYRPGGNGTHSDALLRPEQRLREPGRPPPAGTEPTFREFVRYLIATDLSQYADDHWIPYHLYCTPCLLQYDIVAKVETLQRDQLYMLRSVGVQDVLQPRWMHRSSDAGPHRHDLARIYFSQLDTDLVYRLYDKYKLDFELFGYTPEEYYNLVTPTH